MLEQVGRIQLRRFRLHQSGDGIVVEPGLVHQLDQRADEILAAAGGDVGEGERAWNTGLWFEMTNGGPDGSIALPSFGIYEDELARVGGRWLFTRRKICNEFLPGRESGAVNPVRTMDAASAS